VWGKTQVDATNPIQKTSDYTYTYIGNISYSSPSFEFALHRRFGLQCLLQDNYDNLMRLAIASF